MRAFLYSTIFIFVLSACSTSAPRQSGVYVAESVDFGDMTSATLVGKAWEASADKDFPEVYAFTFKCEEMYGDEAKKMNAAMNEFEPSATASQKWALNDVGTCLFIMADAYVRQKKYKEASETYQRLADNYKYAQCWDPKGWFWRPAEGAANKAKQYKYR